MKAAGASRVVALVKEDLDQEVADFRASYWSDEVLLDETKSFFLALGGGRAHSAHSLASFMAMMMNPLSKSRTKKAFGRPDGKKISNDTKGEGFISGGLYVLGQDGTVAYAFLEEEIGDHAPVEDVIEAVRAAVKGEQFNLVPRKLSRAAVDSERMTWKQWAGRTSGPDGYQMGDITRGESEVPKTHTAVGSSPQNGLGPLGPSLPCPATSNTSASSAEDCKAEAESRKQHREATIKESAAKVAEAPIQAARTASAETSSQVFQLRALDGPEKPDRTAKKPRVLAQR